MAAKLTGATIEHYQLFTEYLHIMKLYNQRNGMFASPKYDQAELAREHEAICAPDYFPKLPVDHIRSGETLIDRLKRNTFDVLGPVCYGSRVSWLVLLTVLLA